MLMSEHFPDPLPDTPRTSLRTEIANFCFFSWKKSKRLSESIDLLGARPQPPWVGFAELLGADRSQASSASRTRLFLEKEEQKRFTGDTYKLPGSASPSLGN
jgi:hypothetical protein